MSVNRIQSSISNLMAIGLVPSELILDADCENPCFACRNGTLLIPSSIVLLMQLLSLLVIMMISVVPLISIVRGINNNNYYYYK